MNVLIVGSGGREHAFTWKASQSNLVEKIFIAPGNAGTSIEPKAENIDISASDTILLQLFQRKKILIRDCWSRRSIGKWYYR